ncbi:MAG: hypothetical protein WD431_17870 [Cyclobacteriaceae bacterium]
MRKFFLFLIISIFQGTWVWGQSDQVFEGEYEFNGEKGIATFEFKEDKDDQMVLDGFFRFELKKIDSLDQTLLTKFQANGEYNENKKGGYWVFNKERHKVNLKDVINFEVKAELVSEELEVRATYKDGIREGGWGYEENVFTQGKLTPKATATRINFSKGFIVDDLYFRSFEGDFTQFIRGEINENGFMDGEWSLVYLKDSVLVSEVRNYENGFLLGLKRRNLESGDPIDDAIFYSTIEKLNLSNEGDNEGYKVSDEKFGLVFNDGFQFGSDFLKIQFDGNEFINQFISKLLQFDNSVNEDGEIMEYPFFTKRFEFDFSKETEESLEEIPEVFEQLETIVAIYREMNSLSLNKGKSDSLSFAYEYFLNRANKIKTMTGFLDVIKTGAIKNYDLDNFTREGVGFMSPMDLITYEYKGDTIRKVINRVVNMEGNEKFIKSFELYLREELAVASKLGEHVASELYEIEISSKLLELEAEILNRKNLVDSLYLNHEATSDNEQQLFLALYRTFLQNKFDSFSEEYANENEFGNKNEKGNLIVDLLSEMEKRLPELSGIYPVSIEIDEIYREETFNPFTYTRFDVRAKERLFESGFLKLFNHYIQELKEEDDYTQIKEHLNKIEKLQERMIELRDANTRGLERRLRRNNNPDRIETLLGI